MTRPDSIGIMCVILVFVISGTSISQSFAQTPQIPVTIENSTAPSDSSFRTTEKTEVAVLSTKFGDIAIAFNNVAPKTAANFVNLANSGFYDGTVFHRIMPGFVIQGGDPNTKKGDKSTWGLGDAGYTIPPEFSKNMSFTKGMVGMARGSDINSASSQFFITLGDAPWLNDQYTLFGQVISGQDVVDKIAALQTNPDNNQPVDADAARISKIVTKSQNTSEEPIIKQEQAIRQQEQITSQQETLQKTTGDNKTTVMSGNNTSLTRQYYHPGFGQGQEPDLLAHTGTTSGSVTASNDGMSVMNTSIYSLKFPAGWQHNFDGYSENGYQYDIAFFENPNKTNSAQMVLSSRSGFLFGDDPYSGKLLYSGIIGLKSAYDSYDAIKVRPTTPSNVGSLIVTAFWVSNAYVCDKYAPNKEHDYGCLDVEVNAIRFDRVDGVPAFQFEYSYKQKNEENVIEEYKVLDTVYILKDAHVVLASQAPINEYDKLEPYFLKSANSLLITPLVHESDDLANRLMSDFNTFEIDPHEFVSNHTKTSSHFTIEHQFPSGSNSASTSVNGITNFLQSLFNWFHL